MTPDLPARVREALDGELAKCAGSYDACCEEHQDAALAAVIAVVQEDRTRGLLSDASVERLWSYLPLHVYCRCEPEWDEMQEVFEVNPDTCQCDRRTIPCVRNSLAALLGEPQIPYLEEPHD